MNITKGQFNNLVEEALESLPEKIKKATADKHLHIEKQTEERVNDILQRFGG